MDVAGEGEIDAALFEQGLQRTNLLVGVMVGRAMEGGHVEANDFPFCRGRHEIALEPLPKRGGIGGHSLVDIHDDKVSGAVVEGISVQIGITIGSSGPKLGCHT